MKPLKLSIQAFGPFAGLQQIDFSLLGQSPLFLINGPTGAGKSSILDAICFALYGKTTADERDASDMRCDQAADETLTKITLDFELAGKQYRILRSPQQDRPKARGDGFTRHSGEASLWSLDADGKTQLIVAKKVKEANQQIEMITGLNVDQFRQVMVLPQGKFRELLLADSAEREKIFGQLFQTHIYKRIEDRLKQQAIGISNEVRDLDNQIKGILQSAELNTEDEIEQQFELLKPELKQSLKDKQAANTKLQKLRLKKQSSQQLLEKFTELEKSKKELSILSLQQAGISTTEQALDAALKAQKIKPKFDELCRQKELHLNMQQQMVATVQRKNEAEQLFINAQKNQQKATESFAEVDLLKATRQQIEQYSDKIYLLNEAKKTATQSALTESESSSTVITLQQQLDSKNNDLSQLQKKLTGIHLETAELGNKQVELERMQQQFQQRQKLAGLQTRFSSALSKQSQQQNELGILTDTADESHLLAKKQEMLWHSGQAMNLARELKQDQPCPVCGSTSHPSPALPDDHHKIVNKEQVDLARTQADNDKQKQRQLQDQLNEINIVQKQLQKDITEKTGLLGDSIDVSDQSFKQSLDQLNAAVVSLIEQQASLLKIGEAVSQHQSAIEQLNRKLTETQQLQQQYKNQSVKDQAAVKHISGDIPEQYQQKLFVETELEKILAFIKNLTEDFNKANDKAQQSLMRFTELKTTVKDLSERDKTMMSDIEVLKTSWNGIIASSVFDTEQDFNNALLTEQQQLEITEEITAFNDQLKKINSIVALQQGELTGKTEPDLTQVIAEVSESEQAYKKFEQQWLQLDGRVNQLKSVQKKLQQAHQTNAELEARYAIYGTLSDVANGRTNHKISLQRFVLSVLLDDVLIQASQRLSLMSKGRYQLLRRQQSSDNRKVSGLELDIEDAYTGKTRSVATLSGGESFMAALSLALGLSDVVQTYAGGIKLDTLFIDEGFGSLDQESLDLAIRTLVDLQATGRMIGIISHVSELKEQMALRLDVISSKTGSSVKIVTA